MKVGFIGLGNLGKEIAKRLLLSGFNLVVWNRTIEKTKELGDVELAKSPAEVADKAEPIFVIVFDSKASAEVIFGEGGLVNSGNLVGKTVIDMTTNDPKYVTSTGEKLRKLGVSYIDAPILGSIIPARRGELTLLLAGDKERCDKYSALFRTFAKTTFYLGELGNASVMKLVNNMVLGGFMEILAEALAISEKFGFDKSLVLDILSNGAGRSMILDVKRDKLLNEDFSTHFSIDLIYKDLRYFEDLIAERKEFSVTVAVIKELYGLARKKGLGPLDFSAIYSVFKEQPL